MSETTTPPPPPPCPPPPPRPPNAADEVPPEIRDEILKLHGQDYGSRRIAKRVGKSRKIVRRVLD